MRVCRRGLLPRTKAQSFQLAFLIFLPQLLRFLFFLHPSLKSFSFSFLFFEIGCSFGFFGGELAVVEGFALENKGARITANDAIKEREIGERKEEGVERQQQFASGFRRGAD
jgi:hypothetical protein